MKKETDVIGDAMSRVEGILKVTGTANYAMDFPVNNPAHGFLFKSEIAAGKILSIDTSAAEKAEGVIAVITHENTLKVKPSRSLRGGAILQDADIEYWGENIGVVVAETFEQARFAARLIKVEYQKTAAKVDFEKEKATARKSKDREDEIHGDVEKAFKNAAVKV